MESMTHIFHKGLRSSFAKGRDACAASGSVENIAGKSTDVGVQFLTYVLITLDTHVGTFDGCRVRADRDDGIYSEGDSIGRGDQFMLGRGKQ